MKNPLTPLTILLGVLFVIICIDDNYKQKTEYYRGYGAALDTVKKVVDNQIKASSDTCTKLVLISNRDTMIVILSDKK